MVGEAEGKKESVLEDDGEAIDNDVVVDGDCCLFHRLGRLEEGTGGILEEKGNGEDEGDEI